MWVAVNKEMSPLPKQNKAIVQQFCSYKTLKRVESVLYH